MKLLKTIFIGACLLILGLAALILSPLKESVLDEIQMEANALLNEFITSPDSPRLAPLTVISGQPIEIRQQSKTAANTSEIDAWLSQSQTKVLLIQRRGEIIYESYSADSKMGLQIR
ncbi:MAG: hypothetical protein HOJ99_03585 [Porticoccaceae bacterium]|jgi:peptidyl-tRNA hydrolase|nr:hypothetical protein [Porticoccaceae bacterium]MBT5577562.1 hypothetical protein [Porticoccaceae bacterium]